MKKAADTSTARCKYGAACPYRTHCRYRHDKKEIALFWDHDNNMDNFLGGNTTKSVVAYAQYGRSGDCPDDCHRLGRCICNEDEYWAMGRREEEEMGTGSAEEETGSTGSAEETGSAGEETDSTDSADNDVDYWALAADYEEEEDTTDESATRDTADSVDVQTNDGMAHQLKAQEEFQVGMDVWAKTYTRCGEFYFINLNTWESRWDPLNLEPDRAHCGYNNENPPPSVLE